MLIPEWRKAWRFWSVQLNALGVTVAGYLMLVPDAAIAMWGMLPPEFKAAIPPQYMPVIGLVIAALGTVARVVQQRRLHESDS